MKIAILTVHRAFNMGALLQAWALKRVLEKMGHSVEMPELNTIGMVKRKVFSLRLYAGSIARLALKLDANPLRASLGSSFDLWRHNRFIKKQLNSVPCSLEELRRYDLIIVGSDQVWNQAIMKGDSSLFFGETIPAGIPVIGYALSMGDEASPATDYSRIAAAVRRFKAITVRERFIQKTIEDMGFPSPKMVLDPTLLLTAEDYAEIEAPRLIEEPYLFVYNIGGGERIWTIADTVAKRIGVNRIAYSCGTLGWSPNLRQGHTWGDSPNRFLSYVRHAKACLVSSFHGTAFSLIYDKPFVSVSYAARENLNNARQARLLELVGQQSHLKHISDSAEEIAEVACSHISSANESDLHTAAAQSRQILAQMIKGAQ